MQIEYLFHFPKKIILTLFGIKIFRMFRLFIYFYRVSDSCLTRVCLFSFPSFVWANRARSKSKHIPLLNKIYTQPFLRLTDVAISFTLLDSPSMHVQFFYDVHFLKGRCNLQKQNHYLTCASAWQSDKRVLVIAPLVKFSSSAAINLIDVLIFLRTTNL